MSQQQIQPPKGMNDILPAETAAWQRLETLARDIFASYAYQEIRLPLVEHTGLFKRSIGEFTDVVSKEMYTFDDPSGDSLTLRPEATAGIVRAMISNGLLHNQTQRVWTAGPMFRHENTQRGRFRQFNQLDVEAFGYPGPDIDAEVILLSSRLLTQAGVKRLELNLNSLGTPASRRVYREKLVEYFTAHKSKLDADSLKRLDGNPLRILDSKNPELQDIIRNAPILTEHLDEESRTHFGGLCRHLDALGVKYVLNPRLVRGLDYYTHTVFEWVTTELGSQGAVCSGGRYDGLVEQLGGKPTPAIGWAAGQERIVDLVRVQNGEVPAPAPDVYFVIAGQRAEAEGLRIAETLRDQIPGLRIEMNCGGGSFKSQLKRSDKSGAAWALILGDSETEKRVAGLKSLRVEAPQVEVAWERLVDELGARLAQR
ncbi:histidine--tRNA ligase [Steroidobacter agaridevorans]|uniref:Histidine--tRNA ligase n=1 Tax=Steroidobacter agaridevorans TaxID=2695856 RepID=A0A829YB81_9GAMM|nr:histidine--tRNA ligase [Steroidobacter agaridevorans]GFE80375.1 histidine--tRNA ligase [Steroidobacter agaridevorans]GFE87431.1 histidine--tRNA ligase [Steroidobacter agaridevorans]